MRKILLLLLMFIAIGWSALIENCGPKFDDLIQMRNFKPMIVQYACSSIFPEDNCPLEDPNRARYILGELEKMLIKEMPILRVKNTKAQIPLDSSYLSSFKDPATLTCFYGHLNKSARCIGGADANNVLSNLLPEIYQHNSSLLKYREYNPKGRHSITINSNSESDWIQIFKAKFGSIADTHIKLDLMGYNLIFKTRSGYEQHFWDENASSIILFIESVLENEKAPTNVIDLKYGQKLKSVVPEDKPLVLQLYYDSTADRFSSSSIELVNFVSQVYSPDVVFVRAFIPLHMPLLLEYAHYYYYEMEIYNPILFFPRGYNHSEQICVDTESKSRIVNYNDDISERYFIKELAKYGFDKQELASGWKKVENQGLDDIERTNEDNILRIYYRGYYNRILSLEQRDALRSIRNHFNHSQQIEFIDCTGSWLENYHWMEDFETPYMHELRRYDVFIFTARFNKKVVNRFLTKQIESGKIIQFIQSASEDVKTIWWSIYSLWDDLRRMYDINFRPVVEKWL